MSRLGDISFITKLAGFEHTKYIQGRCTHNRINESDIPLFIGRTVKNGIIDKNYDWYIPLTLSEELTRSQLRKKCIVLPYVGTVGDLAIYDGTFKAHLGSNIAKIELNENSGYTNEFVYYFLKSPYGQRLLLKDLQGAIQKNITMEAIRNVELPDLSIDKQFLISSVLDCLNNKIENNNKIISELESMTKTIYNYWFLQFEFPNEEGKPYKSSGGKMVWNDELKREIPDGWKVKSYSKLGKLLMGQSPKSDSYNNEGIGYPLINGAAELREDSVEISKYTSNPTRVSQIGDLLFCIRATIGNLQFGQAEYCLGRGVASYRPNSKKHIEYLYFVTNDILTVYNKILTGSIIVGISKDDLLQQPILTPNESIINAFSEAVHPMFEKNTNLKQENQELASLRDFLLPLLMNGQVTFKEDE